MLITEDLGLWLGPEWEETHQPFDLMLHMISQPLMATLTDTSTYMYMYMYRHTPEYAKVSGKQPDPTKQFTCTME